MKTINPPWSDEQVERVDGDVNIVNKLKSDHAMMLKAGRELVNYIFTLSEGKNVNKATQKRIFKAIRVFDLGEGLFMLQLEALITELEEKPDELG